MSREGTGRQVVVAKSAGFCFGVERAVKAKGPIYTFGPIIHNEEVVKDLEEKGVMVLEDEAALRSLPKGQGTVIIRSHGVSRHIYDILEGRGVDIVDATCPFVAKIHRLARRAGEEGRTLLVAGDENHPEVQGIVGHTRGSVFVFADLEELKALLTPENTKNGIFVVAQTTFEVKKWQECVQSVSEWN